MKYGAGSDLERESFARSSSACMDASSAPDSASGCGAPQLSAPLAARAATKRDRKEIERSVCLIRLFDVLPPASIDASHANSVPAVSRTWIRRQPFVIGLSYSWRAPRFA